MRSQPSLSAPLVEAPPAYHGFARNTHTCEMESSSRASSNLQVLMRIGCSKMLILSFDVIFVFEPKTIPIAVCYVPRLLSTYCTTGLGTCLMISRTSR